jgi:hypothetical protein
MTFDWPNLVVGAVLGVLGHWAFVHVREWSARRKLKQRYAALAGSYAQYEANPEVPTGGTIDLSWIGSGSFKVKALHGNGTMDWEGVMHLQPQLENTWTGSYWLPDRSGHGVKQMTYVPNTRSFSVLTTPTSWVGANPFIHHWKRIER